jgi:hypothetical protein
MDSKQYLKKEIAKVAYDHILFLALALACLAAGTAWGSDKSTNQSKAGLAFDTTHVSLGNVEQDSKGTVTFLAINYGALPIKVGPVNIVALQGGDTGSSLQDTVSVSANGVYAIPIQVGPYKQLGPHTMQVTVTSNDPKAQTTTLTVDFTVVEGPARQAKGPRLRVDKQLIDIGNVPYDWPLYEQFTLRNDGDAPLVLAGTPTIRVELGC